MGKSNKSPKLSDQQLIELNDFASKIKQPPFLPTQMNDQENKFSNTMINKNFSDVSKAKTEKNKTKKSTTKKLNFKTNLDKTQTNFKSNFKYIKKKKVYSKASIKWIKTFIIVLAEMAVDAYNLTMYNQNDFNKKLENSENLDKLKFSQKQKEEKIKIEKMITNSIFLK